MQPLFAILNVSRERNGGAQGAHERLFHSLQPFFDFFILISLSFHVVMNQTLFANYVGDRAKAQELGGPCLKEKELKRMNRRELLELLVAQSRENDRLRQEADAAKRALEERAICIEQAGSIADAAMQLNHVFTAAQQAADQYLENIRSMCARQEQLLRAAEEEAAKNAAVSVEQTTEKCREIEAATAKKCAAMLRLAQQYAGK